MGVPIVKDDVGGVYVLPGSPPQFATFPMLQGASRTFFNGRSVMLLGQALTAGGPIATATLVSQKTLIEDKPVLLSGAVTTLQTGWLNGTLIGVNAANAQVA